MANGCCGIFASGLDSGIFRKTLFAILTSMTTTRRSLSTMAANNFGLSVKSKDKIKHIKDLLNEEDYDDEGLPIFEESKYRIYTGKEVKRY
jgi:hypothetical protein